MDHLFKGKENILNKKNIGGFISDDGFALGLAYLLKILSQNEKFKSLNWFQGMTSKLQKDQQEAEWREKEMAQNIGNQDMAYEDQKLDQEITRRRIERLSQEYEMLHY